jgi:cytochrome c oxidase subunit II
MTVSGHRPASGLAASLGLAACGGPQSTLDPAGTGAEQIADLFWIMTAGAAAIWLVVVALATRAALLGREPRDRRYGARLIVGGGVVLPTFVLAALLAYGLVLMPPLLAAAPEGSLRVFVEGEQYWWRVRYLAPGGKPVDLANEIRLPVGAPVQFELASRDVIHSFWIPALAGKMDMIPGRATRLAVQPTRTGTFRGTCAEYCGASHALMSFPVVVLKQREFVQWLARQAEPATEPTDAAAKRGKELFSITGCGGCHTVRGTDARGTIGPDLTHVGGRASLGAGAFPNDAPHFERWLAQTEQLKPGVLMPHFGMLPAADRRALAAYLEGLQ